VKREVKYVITLTVLIKETAMMRLGFGAILTHAIATLICALLKMNDPNFATSLKA
jgi:hypothetical protein